MSKRNKRKNHHKFQSANKEEWQESKDAVETQPVVSNSHYHNHDSQASAEPSTDAVEASSAPAGVGIPIEVVPEEKPAQTVTVASPVVAGQQKSKKMAKAFVWGLLVGALIVSVLF